MLVMHSRVYVCRWPDVEYSKRSQIMGDKNLPKTEFHSPQLILTCNFASDVKGVGIEVMSNNYIRCIEGWVKQSSANY